MALRDDFIWGFATAAAQIEGGGVEQEKASGKGPSVSLMISASSGGAESARFAATCDWRAGNAIV